MYRKFTEEAEWLVPAFVLTAAMAAFAIGGSPDHSAILPGLLLLPLWLVVALAVSGIPVLWKTFQMMAGGIDHPLAKWWAVAVEHRMTIAFIAFGMLLSGLNMITFMWVKPLLNHLVPFWADPYLASIDRTLFGIDPWRLTSWLNGSSLALFYHRAWFALILLLLLRVLASPSSPAKSALMLTYFLLWSVFGPLVHALAPAAGPIFFERLGYGTAFASIPALAEVRDLGDYLWHAFVGTKFGPASGISAMPSLHIATTVWIVIATYVFAKRWLLPIGIIAVTIFLLSISLGWHYAIDGIVGGAGTLLIYRLTSRALSARSKFLQERAFRYVG